MKRLIVLALLLTPASLHALGSLAIDPEAPEPALAPPAPLPPPPPMPVGPARFANEVGTACEGEEPACCEDQDEVESAAPWFRPSGADEASLRFRHGDGPDSDSGRVVVRSYQSLSRRIPTPPPATRRPSPTPADIKTIEGELSLTRERALASAFAQLDKAVADWVVPDVPRSWKAPRHLVRAFVGPERNVEEVQHKDLGTFYKATLRADFSRARRAEVVRAYERTIAVQRMGVLGVALLAALAVLAALAGYIRADEATKGFYTNRLRLLTAAGLGAAGVAAYQILT